LVLSFKFLLFAVLVAIAPYASADEDTCGALTNAFGPFDYRNAQSPRQIVESYHFTRDVEMLKAGSTGPIGADLDYTLRAFPNHYRALAAMMNLQFKAKTERPQGTNWSVPCYFDRAMRFVPDDGTVHTIYGVYMMRLNRTADAIEQFELAGSLGDDSANLHYNLGLAYFDVGQFDKSIAQAQKAYALGFGLPGLKQKLTRAGKWPSAN
jgi:tetratricopeptide (TPR) repeat protein